MKVWKYILIIGIILLLIGCGLILKDFGKNNASFAANFADNILRPLLGNTTTIKLETDLFNIQDKVAQITYKQDPSLKIASTSDKLIWKPILEDKNDVNNPIIQTADFHPDPDRPYALVHLIKIDSKKIDLRSVAGTKEPASEVGIPGPGVIPEDIKNGGKLIAAFNGGFQYRDGQYGLVVDNKTYLPLKESLATMLVDKEGKISIEEYQNSLDLSKYFFARQNGEMLVKNDVVIPSSNDKLAKNWGRSVTSSMYTWRSGAGVNSEGKLIYAVGSYLIPETLGKSLKAAEAVNAMQLDINPFWVRFSVFKQNSDSSYSHQSLFSGVYDGGENFLNGDKKDFFYMTLKEPAKINQLVFKNLTRVWTKDK